MTLPNKMSAMFRKPGDDTSTMSDQPSDGNQDDVLELTSPISPLDPSQHFTILCLSLVEKECREKAINAYNILRAPSDYLAGDHPDVLALSTRLYNQAVSRERSEILPRDMLTFRF